MKDNLKNQKSIINDYNAGLTIKEIANKYNFSYEKTRKILKGKVNWRRKYISDFTEEQIQKALDMFDNKKSVKEIAKWFEISPPAISRLLRANNREPEISSRKYNLLRATPISAKQKQFIVGHLLGDGCLYRDGKNSLYKLTVAHKKAHKEYFHWKMMMLDPFINTWRESIDKRGNSAMLQTTTICHQELKQFADMFYTKERIKVVPKNLDMFMTPLALAVWIMDDGNLNAGVNMRIATMSFSYEDHVELQSLLKRVFGVRSKIMEFKYKGKKYNQLTLNKKNTQKLSDIIRPHVVECMQYKIMPGSSTTERQTSNKDDDTV